MNNIKKRGLIVDDEEALRDIVTEVLELLNMESAAASSGIEAIKIASDSANHFDIMIIDMYMPNMNGDETYEKLKEFYPDCPVLFISGLDRSDEQEKANPKRNFLKKPFAVKDLQEAINKLIGFDNK